MRGVPSMEEFEMDNCAIDVLEGEIREGDVVAVASDERRVTDDGPVLYGFFEIAVEQFDFLWCVRREIMVVADEAGRFIENEKTLACLPFDFRVHAPMVQCADGWEETGQLETIAFGLVEDRSWAINDNG